MSEIVATCRTIVQDVSCTLRINLNRKKVFLELSNLFKSKLVFLHFHQHKSAVYYHKRKLQCLEHLHSSSSIPHVIKKHPIYRTIRFLENERIQLKSFFALRKVYYLLFEKLQRHLTAIKDLEASDSCLHNASLQREKYFFCTQCQTRLSPNGSLFYSDILTGQPFEYDKNWLRPKIMLEIERISMELDEISLKLIHLFSSISTICMLMLQRLFISYLLIKHALEVKANFKISRETRYRKILELNKKRKASFEFHNRMLQKELCIKSMEKDRIQKDAKEFMRIQEQNDVLEKYQIQQQRDKIFIANYQKTVEVKKTSAPTKFNENFRCYRPRCGGKIFRNENGYNKHLNWHREIENRLKVEQLFLQKIQDSRSNIDRLTVSQATAMNELSHTTSLLDQQYFFFYLSSMSKVDASGYPYIIPLLKSTCIFGRSRSCDVRLISSQFPNLISKKHARITIEAPPFGLKNCMVHFEDLGSRNGSFVNGIELCNGPVALFNGDIIDFGGRRAQNQWDDTKMSYIFNVQMLDKIITRLDYEKYISSIENQTCSRTRNE